MNLRMLLACALLGLSSPLPSLAENGSATAEITAAGNAFLGTLDEGQRGKAIFDFKDDEQRRRWSNLPTGIYKRAGLRLGDLKEAQRDAVWGLLKTALSPSGYEKVRRIVEADEVLKKGSGGGGPSFGQDEYYVSFLGKPSTTEPWMIQFGGHHLALNMTIVGDHGALTPSHTAAQPAIYQIEGKTIRPLGEETDKAFALLSSLDEAQRKQAILGFQMRDLVLGPGHDGQMIQPEGIKGAALTEKQREMLLDLASEWTSIIHEAAAKAKMEEVKKNVNETWFAWSGPTEPGGAAYFRVQGPTVFIEYAPQRLGGDPTRHIHTMYRDPSNEYGAKWLKK